MARHVVPTRWKSGMIEIGPRIFAYVQASGIDPRGDTGVANSGLIVGAEAAAHEIKLGVYASWREPERILPNVMRCYQEFANEVDRDLDIKAVIEGMERLRGRPTDHACV